MEDQRVCSTSSTSSALLLHTLRHARRTPFNRVFAAVYLCAVLALFYHHAIKLTHSSTWASFFISLSFFLSDTVLAFMWATRQCFLMTIVCRDEFPDNLQSVLKKSDFPALDVFIFTADPYKEPPLRLVSTILSVMAYDYPTEKISVYVSDDGGSQVTLSACLEAAKFASLWIPFCRNNNIIDRSPEAYFASNRSWISDSEKIKDLYKSMKIRLENVLEKGEVDEEYITSELQYRALSKWKDGFTRQDHPTVIEILLESSKKKDITNCSMPNLIYVSREKTKTSPHHFKAGALNVLLRVSSTMINAPIILTLDCDMYSNDPQTPLRTLCYLVDPKIRSQIGYIQFPQIFPGINKNDTYSCEYKRPFQTNPKGLDGLLGPNYVGTGCFFNRLVFCASPSTTNASTEFPELGPDHVPEKPIDSQPVLELAYKVAACNYENKTKWGFEMGFRYGSLAEDYYTGFGLQCEGWRSIFCNPKRPAFLGDAPICLLDALNQLQRWMIGALQVAFSKFTPTTFGTRSMGLLMGLAYAHYAVQPLWFFPLILYGSLPQLALLNGLNIFPELQEPWFCLYVFLFLGAYGQDLLEFVIEGGSVQRWWNDQRMWLIRGYTSFLFGFLEYLFQRLGISTYGFSLTSKITDDEQSKRYEQGIFEFGVPSPMFVALTMGAIINLVSFIMGLLHVIRGSSMDGMFLQILIAGFAVLNSLPIYDAMVVRSDQGRMPIKTTIISTFLVLAIYVLVSLVLRN